MTLASQIADDVATVFLNTDDFAQSIRHYPDGDKGGPSHAVDGLLTVDQEQSGNNLGGSALDGDGLSLSNERGVTARHSAILELPISEEVNEQQGIKPSSLFKVDYFDSAGSVESTEYWRAVRSVGHDSSMQSWLVVFVSKHVTRKAMRQ